MHIVSPISESDETSRPTRESVILSCRARACVPLYKPSNMGNIIFSIIWLIVLIFVAFWIAGIAAGIYIIVLPFTVCIEALTGLTDFLLSVVQFPRYCAQGMVEGRGFN